MTAPLVIVTRKLPPDVQARLSALFACEFNDDDVPMSAAQLSSAISRADVLVPTVTDKIDGSIISKASARLKLIANFGAGTDHIDVLAAHRKGILVTNTPGVLTEDTADLTMAIILALPRRLVEADRRLRDGGFSGWSPTWMTGRRVRGMKLGIVGMGRIGQAVARRAGAFGLSVHYHNRTEVPRSISEGLQARYWDDLDAMLSAVDIVSINCPSTPQTRHMINAQRLRRLGPQSYIVNTSRGDVIDEAALAAALRSGEIAGAGLDVYEREPDITPDLIDLPNVILAPHIGSATEESRQEMGEKVMINIRAVMDAHMPPDRVLPPRASYNPASGAA
ncbi:2-hydroxyacid dehydrogenase [Robiginitomaculum antarcticum]|uniref:2-hydroxyacid dehydrogenase n=1 Tax=Robiginitomaculum antarcticum TaxID=437507 RepID=UPI000687F620|nr:D-glycerate dehydrogenase [Robiginitomaculum antarcticum]